MGSARGPRSLITALDRGGFADLGDLVRRSPLGRPIDALVRAGAREAFRERCELEPGRPASNTRRR